MDIDCRKKLAKRYNTAMCGRAMLGAVLVGLSQVWCQAAGQGDSLTREFTATERTELGLFEDQLTYTLSWDRWKEDKSRYQANGPRLQGDGRPLKPGIQKG